MVAIALLASISLFVLLATPFLFLLIEAGEAFNGHGERLHYHWLAFIPLALVVLFWIAFFTVIKLRKKSKGA